MTLDTVFKAYDIRGRTDTGELGPDLYRSIGNAFAGFSGAPAIAVGRDCRMSSSSLFAALADGITAAGADVIDLGEVPTDLVYFVSGSRDVPGAMITASHNPPEYNGLKLCLEGAFPVGSDSGLGEIKDKVAGSVFSVSDRPGGTMTDGDPVGPYVSHLFDIVDQGTIGPLRVAVDAGNGMAGVTLAAVFAELDAALEGLYLEPDGTFPNHPADPIQPENLVDLVDLVSGGEFDLGVAFDGDADRAFFIDERSVPLSGSTITALISRWMLDRYPGGTIVHNLITSRAVPEVVVESGGVPVRTRVGHSFIKQIMAETGAVFGGEHSGHYYFAENYRADSGMLAMLILLRVLSEDGRPLSELRQDVERYAVSGEINFEVSDPAESVGVIADSFKDAEVDRLDGLSVDIGSAWFNVRPSNTEPLLRLNVEATSDEQVTEMVESIQSILEVAT